MMVPIFTLSLNILSRCSLSLWQLFCIYYVFLSESSIMKFLDARDKLLFQASLIFAAATLQEEVLSLKFLKGFCSVFLVIFLSEGCIILYHHLLPQGLLGHFIFVQFFCCILSCFVWLFMFLCPFISHGLPF